MDSKINNHIINIPNIETQPTPEVIKKEKKAGLGERIERAFWTGLGIWTTYNLVDQGLANFLCLET